VFTGILGLLNHSNADWQCGFLDTLLNTPNHHRAHHAVIDPGAHSNYGSFFNFADRVFGTRYLPKPEEIGELELDDIYDMPNSIIRHMAVPFRRNEIHKTV
jgi:sterol desaturase/sphingolipid hydroxylase (fatty acid hydroxylase superfamily)